MDTSELYLKERDLILETLKDNIDPDNSNYWNGNYFIKDDILLEIFKIRIEYQEEYIKEMLPENVDCTDDDFKADYEQCIKQIQKYKKLIEILSNKNRA